MARPIDYVESSAGFIVGEFLHANGRKVLRPNTQVSALAIFDGAVTEQETPYYVMYDELTLAIKKWAAKPGRRSSRRKFWQENPGATLHNYRMPMEFLRPWIEENYPDLVWVATTWIGAKEQMHLDEGVFETDKKILVRLSSDQVVPVLDGVAHFPWDPNSTLAFGKSRMVYGYWTTP